MSKNRFTTTDVRGVAKKIFLLIESGMRFHTTRYTRDKNDMPSPFAMKLRKHIRLKRLEDIRQLGSDRVVDMKFGSGDAVCHIILELYASGNMVLTDGNYEILALLRSHKFEDDIAVQAGEIYPIAFTTTVAPTEEAKKESKCSLTGMQVAEFIAWVQERQDELQQQNEEQQRLQEEAKQTAVVEGKKGGNNKTTSQKKQRVKKLNLRQLLQSKQSGVAMFGPEILDHCLISAGFSPTTKVPDILASPSEELEPKVKVLLEELRVTAPKLLVQLDAPGQEGFILMKEATGNSEEAKKTCGEYFDFVPRMFKQHEGIASRQFASFDEAVDEYFCKVEEQRLQHQATNAEEAAKKKVKKVKDEMNNQLQGLVDTQVKMEKAASLTEAFADEVDKACLVINSALSAGISWEDVATMVSAETAAGNPIASLISKLKLDKNRVVLRLPDILAGGDSDDDDNEDDEGDGQKKSFVDVEIDLGLSAYANASKLYSQRKVAQSKEKKTAVAAERAIKAAEQSSAKQLNKQQVKRNLQAKRKVHWFEKFNWFISSEGYLVLSGRDAQQNEQLVKKYLRNGDAYVHADMHGASSCVVRCKMKKDPETGSETPLPISPIALNEAGTMTICRSGAWSAKIVMSAWWVHSSQVSKTAPTGEYLSTGSFMIYGKKNFLPPTTLEMGFGILFRLDDGSVPRHLSDRVDKSVVTADDVSEKLNLSGSDKVDEVAIGEAVTSSVSRATLSERESERGKKRRGKESRRAAPASDGSDVKNMSEGDSNNNVEETEPSESSAETSRGGEVTPAAEFTPPPPPVSKKQNKANDPKGGKKKLSAFERKMLKKGKTLEEIEELKAEKNAKELEDKEDKEEETADVEVAPVEEGSANATSSSQVTKKKKKLSKKKARRYAEQDEEDLTLAMRALGHLPEETHEGESLQSEGGGKARSGEKLTNDEKKAEKQRKAGIHLLQDDWETCLAQLEEGVRDELGELISRGVLKKREIDSFELSTLGTFTAEEGCEILSLFDCDGGGRIGNKSGFLAGIMRRFSREKLKKKADTADEENDSDEGDTVRKDETHLSRRERKKNEAKEIQHILEEEGMLEEQEGKQAEELEKLTGQPLPEDVLLYAVPVCGPFSAMKNFKYKVKLTPGTIKKGKACKNAVDVFVSSKQSSSTNLSGHDVNDVEKATNSERSLIKALTDPEMVAIMIGDVKLSMPGLYSTLKKKKEASKKAKKK